MLIKKAEVIELGNQVEVDNTVLIFPLSLNVVSKIKNFDVYITPNRC